MGFTFRHLKPTDPYYACWLERKRLTRVFWLALLAWPIVTLALHEALEVLCQKPGFLFALLPTLPVVFLLSLQQARWPCPRCGNSFYARQFRYFPFANSCLHCGLLEYAGGDARETQGMST
jgi:ribosomal protein S27AE